MPKVTAQLNKQRIGIVSTRFSGTDGVSLETEKWAAVLTGLGHTCYYFAGDSDRAAELNFIVPEALFKHPEIDEIYVACFDFSIRKPEITRKIQLFKDFLKDQLYQFLRKFDITMLIVENALAIPLNIPLGLALTELIIETNIPTIAHHHDFFWERKRFLVNCVWDYLNMAFPPHLPSIRHVVINSSAANQLSLRTGISSTLIPNVMDFDNHPNMVDDYNRDIRQSLNVLPHEKLFLQPTRVVPRKGIEHAIEIVSRVDIPSRLVISHASGDEGYSYEKHLRNYAEMLSVPVNFVCDIIREHRGTLPDGRKVYTLWDLYPHADLVTYPSDIEGFGNAFLEAIYYRKPIVVNSYSIFDIDLKPKGFKVITFDGYITSETIEQTQQVLNNDLLSEEMAEINYEIGRRFYSYSVLERKLQTLLSECFGKK